MHAIATPATGLVITDSTVYARKSCSPWMLMCLQEKKKRDTGQQSRGKSTVEEEKRIARNFGVYSGFD